MCTLLPNLCKFLYVCLFVCCLTTLQKITIRDIYSVLNYVFFWIFLTQPWEDSTLDQIFTFQISDFIWCLLEIIATLLVISLVTPLFLTAVIPIILVFLIIQRLYIVTSRQLKRLYFVSKSPIFSHFSETVSGAQVIRAFQVIIG